MQDLVQKCLKCKNARCQNACPIKTPIPEIIQLYQDGKIQAAQEKLFDHNIFSSVCALVCDHSRQCLGNCILNAKNDPVPFYLLEQGLSLDYLNQVKLTKQASKDQRVAIVGAGPSGLTMAIILARKGYKVTIFDANAQIGGILRYGIPEVRLPKSILDQYQRLLLELGVKFRANMVVGNVITIDQMLADSYDAIYIATGVWNPRKLNIKGETLGNVHYAIDYLKSPDNYIIGNKVIVIGAGNVAMDAARTLKRQNKDVYVYYRKGFDDMPANTSEITDARQEGVNFELFKAPIRIVEDGIYFDKTENIVVDGRVQTKIIENTEELVHCDDIMIAVSQDPHHTIVKSTQDLQTNKWGLLVTDDLGHTTKDGVFASGDVVTGAKTVVDAIRDAKVVSETIDQYLSNK